MTPQRQIPVTESQLDYFMNVIVRNFCRTMEENDVMLDEMCDLKESYFKILQENADLRFKLKQSGIEVPHSTFTVEEDN